MGLRKKDGLLVDLISGNEMVSKKTYEYFGYDTEFWK